MSRYLALRVEGPLAPAATGLWGELRERGYSPNRVRTRVRLVLELSCWMNEHGVGLAELNFGMLETLAGNARAERQRTGRWFAGRWFSSASERDVLAHLRELGIIEPAAVPVPTQLDLIVARMQADEMRVLPFHVPRAVRVASAPRCRAPTAVLEPDSMISHAYRQLAHHLLRELDR